jgi:hypothetical protein
LEQQAADHDSGRGGNVDHDYYVRYLDDANASAIV